MKKLIKIFAIVLVIAWALSLSSSWYKIFILDQYYVHGSIFMNVLIGVGSPLLIILSSIYSIKFIIKR